MHVIRTAEDITAQVHKAYLAANGVHVHSDTNVQAVTAPTPAYLCGSHEVPAPLLLQALLLKGAHELLDRGPWSIVRIHSLQRKGE